MKVTIHPDYHYLSAFVDEIPSQDYSKGTVLKKDRNILVKYMTESHALVVKQYKKPLFLNRIVYTFFRKSKARRSFEYAFRLKKLGIGTAEPIAYIEEKKNGLFHTGYFVSKFIPHPLISSLTAYNTNFMDDFIRFTVELHKKGVILYDYNFSNIFFHKEDEHYQFDLIDINRMAFNTYSKQMCLRALRTMGLQLSSLTAFAEQYAILRGWNAEFFCGSLLTKRGLKNNRIQLKRKLKKAIGLTVHII